MSSSGAIEKFGYIIVDQNGTTLTANIDAFEEMQENPYQIVGNLFFSLKTIFEINLNMRLFKFELGCCQITFMPRERFILFVLAHMENGELNSAKMGILLRNLGLAAEQFLASHGNDVFDLDTATLKKVLDRELERTISLTRGLLGVEEIKSIANRIRNNFEAEYAENYFSLPLTLLNDFLEMKKGAEPLMDAFVPLFASIESEEALLEAFEQERYERFSFGVEVFERIQNEWIRVLVLDAWLSIQGMEPRFYIPPLQEIVKRIEALDKGLGRDILESKARRFLFPGTVQEVLVDSLKHYDEVIEGLSRTPVNSVRRRVLALMLIDVPNASLQKLLQKHFEELGLRNWLGRSAYLVSLLKSISRNRRRENLARQFDEYKQKFHGNAEEFPLVALRYAKLVFLSGFSLLSEEEMNMEQGKRVIAELFDFAHHYVPTLESSQLVVTPRHLGQIDEFSRAMLFPLYIDVVNPPAEIRGKLIDREIQYLVNHLEYFVRLRRFCRIEIDVYQIIISSLLSSLSKALAIKGVRSPSMLSLLANLVNEVMFEASVALPMYHWSILYVELLFSLLNLTSMVHSREERGIIMRRIATAIFEFLINEEVKLYEVLYYVGIYRLVQVWASHREEEILAKASYEKLLQIVEKLPSFWKEVGKASIEKVRKENVENQEEEK